MLAVINDTGVIVVLVAVVLLFGASRIPKLARNLGEASKEFKSAQDGAHPEQAPALAAPAETVTMTRQQLDTLLSRASTEPAQNQAVAGS